MSNLDIWTKVARPPTTSLKVIGAGRLKGMSDINPQWRYQAMTEQFGICGVGWKFTVDRLWTEPGTGGVVFAFAQVSLYVKVDGAWSDAIPGLGGHKLIEQETKGLHDNDEGFKMATTDALGTAMKMLGVAADIYLGNWDGSKYRDRPDDSPPQDRSPDSKWGKGTKQPATPPTEPPKTAPPKWVDMNKTQKTECALARIASIRKIADPVQAMESLKKVASAVTAEQVGDVNYATIDAAWEAAKQDILSESGQ